MTSKWANKYTKTQPVNISAPLVMIYSYGLYRHGLIVVAYRVMAFEVMASIVMVHIVVAYVVMAYSRVVKQGLYLP